jgi:hypothetical protein
MTAEKKLGGRTKAGAITIMMNAMSPGFNGSQLEWHFDVLLLFQVMEKEELAGSLQPISDTSSQLVAGTSVLISL